MNDTEDGLEAPTYQELSELWEQDRVRADAMEAQRDAVRGVLIRYGRHDDNCSWASDQTAIRWHGAAHIEPRCSCGFGEKFMELFPNMRPAD